MNNETIALAKRVVLRDIRLKFLTNGQLVNEQLDQYLKELEREYINETQP